MHQQIDALEDENALQMLHEAAAEYSKAENASDELTPEQIEKLKASLQQLDKGEWKSHDEVVKQSKTWLQK